MSRFSLHLSLIQQTPGTERVRGPNDLRIINIFTVFHEYTCTTVFRFDSEGP